MKSFGKIITEIRKSRNMSQAELVRLMNEQGIPMKVAALSKWEQDATRPNVLQFFTFCEIMGIKNINSVFHVADQDNHYNALNEEGQRKVDEYTDLLFESGKYKRRETVIVPFKRTLPKYLLPTSAGCGSFLDGYDHEDIEVGNEVSRDADFGVTISGDSMEPQYVNGQLVWVHEQPTLENGEIGIFFLDGCAYIKKLHITQGNMELVSLNSKYDPIPVTENSVFKVFGKVVS